MTSMAPKVFISYSWSSKGHQSLVREWADRLLSDGVEIILDQYDLKEGHDKYVFMEKMVLDETVTHVLIFSDRIYAEKADGRSGGVGTESQIISREVYDSVAQSKFIPIACEVDDDGDPYLPTFLKSRIWIDFRSPEAVNENWEQLVRLLHGKPAREKPKVGAPPTYLASEAAPGLGAATSRLGGLKQAISAGRPGIRKYRADFLESVVAAIDERRVRDRPPTEITGERVLEDCKKLVPIRNLIVDWVLAEADPSENASFTEDLIDFLERLVELKGRPAGLNHWQETWFESQALFAYETFIYVVAALLRAKSYPALHDVFAAKLLLPQSERYGKNRFTTYTSFYASSSILNSVLAAPGQRLYSPAAAMIKQHADRRDISFEALLEADALILLFSVLSKNGHWFPQLLYYLSHYHVPTLFARAASKRHFRALATILGVASGEEVRELWAAGRESVSMSQWHGFHISFSQTLNLEHLDSE